MNKKKWMDRFQEVHWHRPWALITGGSSGMGLEFARQLAEIGCNLLLVSNQKEELEKVVELDPYNVRAKDALDRLIKKKFRDGRPRKGLFSRNS